MGGLQARRGEVRALNCYLLQCPRSTAVRSLTLMNSLPLLPANLRDSPIGDQEQFGILLVFRHFKATMQNRDATVTRRNFDIKISRLRSWRDLFTSDQTSSWWGRNRYCPEFGPLFELTFCAKLRYLLRGGSTTGRRLPRSLEQVEAKCNHFLKSGTYRKSSQTLTWVDYFKLLFTCPPFTLRAFVFLLGECFKAERVHNEWSINFNSWTLNGQNQKSMQNYYDIDLYKQAFILG